MENTSSAAAVRPRLDPVRSLFRNAWQLFTGRFRTLFVIMLVPAIFSFIGQAGLARHGNPQANFLGFLFVFIGGLVTLLATVAAIIALSRDTDFSESYKAGFDLFWPAFWVCILQAIILAGAYVMLIVPGIILSVGLSLSIYTFTLEGKRGLDALALSREYVRGFWWAVLGRSLLLALVWAAANLLIYAPLTVIFGQVAGAAVYAVIAALFTPFSIAYVYALYGNLRRVNHDAPARADAASKTFFIACMLVCALAIVLAITLAAFFATIAINSLLQAARQSR